MNLNDIRNNAIKIHIFPNYVLFMFFWKTIFLVCKQQGNVKCITQIIMLNFLRHKKNTKLYQKSTSYILFLYS